MPDAAAAAADTPGQHNDQDSLSSKLWRLAQNVLLVYVITQAATKFMGPKPEQPTTPIPASTNPVPNAVPKVEIDPWTLPPKEVYPYWPTGSNFDMHVYFTTLPRGDPFTKWTKGYRKDVDEGLPEFVWKNITFGNYDDYRVENFEVKFPESVLNNGTLWADIYLARDSVSLDPRNPEFDPRRVHHVRKLLTPYLPRLKVRKEKNLLAGSEEDTEPEEPDVIVPHWHPNVTLALISDANNLAYTQLPPPIFEHVHLAYDVRDDTGTRGFYKPIVFPNEFWHLREHYIPLNHTTPSLPIQITFQPLSFMKFQLFASLTHGFNEAAKQQGGTAELDEVKRMLLETNPWFLALTAFVSILHVIFEMLAFKSDVSHWRQKKEMVGVSVRTIITNVFVQTVVLLYLIDNNENTSWMILMGSGMGVVIEAWKITKAVDIRIVATADDNWIPWVLDIKDKHVLSEDEKKTQEYDRLAYRYVSYIAIPLLVGYTIYSLIYESHRGWYSFVISTLTSFVYMFGFAQLVPQLIINYKLKSVSHMPMKAMVYKTLSTVVDDFFAFCIKMPFLHRLACFRDDVVFLIFLYQRWIYRIDLKRVNEYGQLANPEEVEGEEKESKKNK